MSEIKRYILILSAILALALSSCNESLNPDEINYISNTIGKLERDNHSRYFIDGDRDSRFYIRNPQALFDGGIRPGERVYIEYTNAVQLRQSVKEVDIFYAYEVPVETACHLSEDNEEAVGDDPIKVHMMWASDDYLNIQYQFFTESKFPHSLSLVSVDHPKKEKPGYIYLEFRHNKNNNTGLNNYIGIISFDIEDYLENAPRTKGFIVRVNTRKGERFYQVEVDDDDDPDDNSDDEIDDDERPDSDTPEK